MDPPHKWESWNHQCTARPKNGACPGKAIYIQLIGSRAVTNRHTSEVQSPAPGTCCFEIGWDILEGHERSWGWALDLSLCVRQAFLYFQKSNELSIHCDPLPPCLNFHLHVLALRLFRSLNPAFTLTPRNRFPLISLPLHSGEAKQRWESFCSVVFYSSLQQAKQVAV
jgi:hypothetical protein